MGQLSFWSADARPRGLGDLEGLLCGPGRAELFGRGSAARLVIVLGASPPEPGDEDPPVEDHPPAPDVDEPPPGVDPEDLAFLDLDPDELAARLGLGPVRDADMSPSRAGGFPDVERQCGRHADTAAPPWDPVLAWRAHAIRCALRARGVAAGLDRHTDGRPVVRSAFRSDLVVLAGAWRGTDLPPGFELDGPRLRLWVLAAGAQHGPAYTLGLDPDARHRHDALLTASRRAGLGATLGGSASVPVLRIAGRRRLGRLAELLGRPPTDLAAGVWPE